MDGWIALHRKLLDNPIAERPHYLAVWVTLLLLANHKDKAFIYKNKKEVCHRGELVTSRASLSKRTGVSQSTIEDILSFLESEGNIRQRSNSKFRLITVTNFESYQEKQQQAIQPADSQPYTNNNVTRKQVDIELVAKQTGVSKEIAQAECDKALDWAKSKGKTFKDYNAYVRNWIRSRDKFSKTKPKQDDWVTSLVRA